MDKIKNGLIIGLTIFIFVLLIMKGCEPEKKMNQPVDVIINTHDTIFAKDTLISFKKIYYPRWDSVFKSDTIFSPTTLQMNRVYLDTLKDKNLDIFTRSEVIGIIKESKVSYKLKVPLVINNILKIEHTEIKYQPSKYSFYTGFEMQGNKSYLNISPYLTLNVNKASITAKYGILDKSIGIGVSYKLFSSKK